MRISKSHNHPISGHWPLRISPFEKLTLNKVTPRTARLTGTRTPRQWQPLRDVKKCEFAGIRVQIVTVKCQKGPLCALLFSPHFGLLLDIPRRDARQPGAQNRIGTSNLARTLDTIKSCKKDEIAGIRVQIVTHSALRTFPRNLTHERKLSPEICKAMATT